MQDLDALHARVGARYPQWLLAVLLALLSAVAAYLVYGLGVP